MLRELLAINHEPIPNGNIAPPAPTGDGSYNIGPILQEGILFPTDATIEGSAQGLNLIISVILGVATTVAGLLLLGYFLYGAFRRLTAGPDSKSVDEANSSMVNALIGFVVVIVLWFIISLIGDIFGINILNPRWLGPGERDFGGPPLN